MASTRISGSTLSLSGAPNKTEDDDNNKTDSTLTMSRTAIVVKFTDQMVRELQDCAQAGKAVQLIGGKTPKIRLGAKVLELDVEPERFRNEIYSVDESTGQLEFAAFASHHASLRVPGEKKAPQDDSGDAALAALKQSLEVMAKQKEDRKAKISDSLMNNNKNAKYLHPSRQLTSLSNRPSSSSTPLSHAPTSNPSEPETQRREKALRFAIVHLLALKPASDTDIQKKTLLPKSQLSCLLPKIAEKSGSLWELSNRSYKELDPWSFKYDTDQRQTAIDNAIRAFDRSRMAKDDKAWQTLLPKEERNKGKVLSRLHLTAERKENAATPALAPSPMHTSAAATPKLGPAVGTPRSAATATGRSAAGISIEKRLKDAKKKGAMEKKKQEKDVKDVAAAASDRESKPRTVTKKVIPPKRVPAKVKSEEVVHSSDDDDEEGEVKDTPKTSTVRKEPPKPMPRPRPAVSERRESSASEASVASQVKVKPKSAATERLGSASSVRKDSGVQAPKPKTDSLKPSVPAKKPEVAAAASARSAAKPKDGSAQLPTKPTSSSQRPAISPRKVVDNKPKVPSPLGTSPPRNASDAGAKSSKTVAKPSTAKPTTSTTRTPEPLSFFGNVKPATKTKIVTKKRPLEPDTDVVEPARKVAKPSTSTSAKSAANGTPVSKPTTTGTSKPTASVTKSQRPVANTDNNLKRKANDLSSGLHDHAASATKHRKTDSGSTHSLALTNSSITSLTTGPTVSPAHSSPSHSDYSDDNLTRILDDEYDGGPLTWEQARAAAETFRSKLYPEYLKLYRRLEQMPSSKVAKDDTVRLWQLHNRLEVVKQRIERACRGSDSS